MDVEGLLLAGGAGRRMGTPKALVDDWLPASVEVLLRGGCSHVTVVLGASADEARARVPQEAAVVLAEDWAEGMSASLRAGLASLSRSAGPGAALVHLVDLPDVGADVVARVIAARSTLARASYSGVPGHPVLLGRAHWAGVAEVTTGDRGARAYLAAHQVELVECADLASGADVDAPLLTSTAPPSSRAAGSGRPSPQD